MAPLALVPNLVTRGRHLHKYQAGEVTQVMESIPWVRCASGNVFNENLFACSISCIIMPRSLESRLGSAQYIHIKSKVGFCFSISCAAIYKPVFKSRRCCNSLQKLELLFCRTGRGIAAEYILR